ncbi:hypothetical protein KAU32_00040 [bacterium]|nr:hypothetical protein [bacterium]
MKSSWIKFLLFTFVIVVLSLSNPIVAMEFSFSEPRLALDVGISGEFDSLFVSDPCVIKVADDRYYMYYTGYGDDKNCRIGLAESSDTESWTKVGMVLDSGLLTDLGVIDLMDPCVIIDTAPKDNVLKLPKGTKIFRMWYSANTHEDNFIFYAESLDGINWTQKVLPVYGRLNGEKRVREPWVIKENNSYLMWYSDGENSNLLKSNNGLKWHYIGNFIRAGEKGHWTSRGIHSVKVFWKNGEKHFLFGGSHRNEEGQVISQIGYGILSNDNRIIQLSDEPIIGNDEILYKYGSGAACGMYSNEKVRIWYSGMNSINPKDDEFIRIFHVMRDVR